MNIKGIIFDMDGVVTQTALLHCKAWKVAIDQLLEQISSIHTPFTQWDYYHYLDGISRQEGLKNFLSARKIDTENLKPYYHTLDECIDKVCEHKNNLILSIIAEDKVKPFEDTLEFIRFLSNLNYRIGIISSSKNCQTILQSAQIEGLFSVRVDGTYAQENGLPPKPHPAK